MYKLRNRSTVVLRQTFALTQFRVNNKRDNNNTVASLRVTNIGMTHANTAGITEGLIASLMRWKTAIATRYEVDRLIPIWHSKDNNSSAVKSETHWSLCVFRQRQLNSQRKHLKAYTKQCRSWKLQPIAAISVAIWAFGIKQFVPQYSLRTREIQILTASRLLQIRKLQDSLVCGFRLIPLPACSQSKENQFGVFTLNFIFT